MNSFEPIHELLWEGFFCPVYSKYACYSFDHDALDVLGDDFYNSVKVIPHMLFRHIINNILLDNHE